MDAVIAIPIVTGMFVGILYALSGFSDSAKSDDLASNPRVKNLLWVVGGAAGIFLGDWKLLANADLGSGGRAALLAWYLASAVVTALLAILLIALVVVLDARSKARRHPSFRSRIAELALTYLQHGYAAYTKRLVEIETVTGAPTAEGVLAETGSALAYLLAFSSLERQRDDADLREKVIDEALGAVEDTVKLFAKEVPDLDVKTNYMVKVDAADLGSASPRFVGKQPLANFGSFLVTKRYRSGAGGTVCLPVDERPNASPLPGAPRCVVTREACILNTRTPSLGTKTDAAVRREIKDFFAETWYQSVLSVPLVHDGKVVGVLNVESNHVDVVGKGPDMGAMVGRALAPHCVVLGEVVARTKGA